MNTINTEEISPPPGHQMFRSSKEKQLLLALILFAFTLLIYNSVSHFQFLNYDDPQYITKNTHVQHGLHFSALRWAITTLEFSNWHPLTWISYLADYQLFRLNPAGYHFMNMVYHAISSVLLFLILYQGTGYLERSLYIATLFAVHPLNIESVAWVSERKNVLSTIFWFLAIWAYGWYARRPNWKRYFVLAVCFALGLMSKPMVITLPCVLLMLDIWPLRRVGTFADRPEEDTKTKFEFVRKNWPTLVLEKIPLFIMSAISAVLTLLAQKHGEGMASIAMYPIRMRIENAIVSYALYIYKGFLPLRLAIFYPHPGYTIPTWKIVSSALLLVTITVVVVRLRVRKPYLLVGWLWFLGTLVPVIGFFQNGKQAMADRYAYTPLIGIFVMLVWTTASWVKRDLHRKIASGILAILFLVALATKTHQALQYWHDNVSVFSQALAVTQKNDVAETNLGEALSDDGKENEAAPHFLNAVRYEPTSPINHYNYGRSLLFAGKPQEAIKEFNVVLQLQPSQAVAAHTYHNMAAAYLSIGKQEEARSSYVHAIQLDPEKSNSYLALGLLELQDNHLDAACGYLQQSVRLQPSDIGYLALGQTFERQGQLAEAKAVYEKAAQTSPGFQQSLDAVQKKMQSLKNSFEPAAPATS